MANASTTSKSGKAVVSTIAAGDFVDSNGVMHKNDIRFSNGQFATVSGREAYNQALLAILRTRRGELHLDTERGIPYFETVFASRRMLGEWANAVRNAVTGEPFVSSIEAFDYWIDDSSNKLKFTLTVSLADGSGTTIEEAVDLL